MGQAWGTTTCCTGVLGKLPDLASMNTQSWNIKSSASSFLVRKVLLHCEWADRNSYKDHYLQRSVFTDIQTSILALPPFRMVKLYFTTWTYLQDHGSIMESHHLPHTITILPPGVHGRCVLGGGHHLADLQWTLCPAGGACGVACRTQRCWLIFKNLDWTRRGFIKTEIWRMGGMQCFQDVIDISIIYTYVYLHMYVMYCHVM